MARAKEEPSWKMANWALAVPYPPIRGGELSAYYMWGFTPLPEAVVQARGQGGERQVEENDVVLVSGNGGVLNYHSTTILSKHPA